MESVWMKGWMGVRTSSILRRRCGSHIQVDLAVSVDNNTDSGPCSEVFIHYNLSVLNSRSYT